MPLSAAYLGVILIWTTTPLAIQWSGQDVGFLFGVAGRMLLGAVAALAACRLLGLGMSWERRALRAYLAAGLGIFSAMFAVYWAAQQIHSGWISVVFGTSPLVTPVSALALGHWANDESLQAPVLLGTTLILSGLGLFQLGDRWWGQRAMAETPP